MGSITGQHYETTSITNMEIRITKKPDDTVLRASIGGNQQDGFYCVYRGRIQDIIQMLEAVSRELTSTFVARGELPTAKEDGRHTDPSRN